MKYRLVFIAVGAAIGLFYLEAGALLWRWAGAGQAWVEIWMGLAALGAVVNVIAAVSYVQEDESPFSAAHLLWLQTYLPLTTVLAAVVAVCAPFVFFAFWLVNALCVVPAQLARAAIVQRRMRARFQVRERCLSWDALEPLLTQGAGVLILDSTPCRPGLVWWTDDELLADAGLLVLADDRFCRVAHEQLDKGVEFLLPLSGFQAKYLDADMGRALLTPLSANFVESKKFLREYPKIVVFSVDRQQGRIAGWSRARRHAG